MAPVKQRFGALPLLKAGRDVTTVDITKSDRRDDEENIHANGHGADHTMAQPKASTLTAQQRSSAVRTDGTAAGSLGCGVPTHHMVCMKPAEVGSLACSVSAAPMQQQEPDAPLNTPHTQSAATYISPTPEQLPPAVRRRPPPPEQQSHDYAIDWVAAAEQIGTGPRQTAQCRQSHRWQRIMGCASAEGVLPPFMKRMLLLTKQHTAQQSAQQPHQHSPQRDSHQEQRQLKHQDTRKRGGAHLLDGAQEAQQKKRTTSFTACGAAAHRDCSHVTNTGQAHSEAAAKVLAQAVTCGSCDMVAETPQQATTTSPTAMGEARIKLSTAEADAGGTKCSALDMVVETPMALQPAMQRPQTVSISVVQPTPLTDAVVTVAQQPVTIFVPSTEAAVWKGASAVADERWGAPPPSRAPSSGSLQHAIGPASPSNTATADRTGVEFDLTRLPAVAAAPTVNHAVLDLYSPAWCGMQCPNTEMMASASATAGLNTARVAAAVGLPPARGPARANPSHALRERWWQLEQQQLLQTAEAGDLQRQQLAVDPTAVADAAVAAAQCDLAGTDPGYHVEALPAALELASEPSLLVEVCGGKRESTVAAAAGLDTLWSRTASAAAVVDTNTKHPAAKEKEAADLPAANTSPVSAADLTCSTVVDEQPSVTEVDGVAAAHKCPDSQTPPTQLLVKEDTASADSTQDSDFRCAVVSPAQTGAAAAAGPAAASPAAGGAAHGREVSVRHAGLDMQPVTSAAPAELVEWHIEPTQSDIIATAGTLLPPTLQEAYVSQSPLLATQPLLSQQLPAAAASPAAAAVEADAIQEAEVAAIDVELLQSTCSDGSLAAAQRGVLPVSALLPAQDGAADSPAAVLNAAVDLTAAVRPVSGSASYSAAAVEEYSLEVYSPQAAGVTQDNGCSLRLLNCSPSTLEGMAASELPSTADTEATAAAAGQTAAAAATKALPDTPVVDVDEAEANALQDQQIAAAAPGAVEAVADAGAMLQLTPLEPEYRADEMGDAAAAETYQQVQQATNGTCPAARISNVAGSHTGPAAAVGAMTVGNVDPDLGIDLELAFLFADQLESCLNRDEGGLGLLYCSHRKPKPQIAQQQQQQQEDDAQQRQEEQHVHDLEQETAHFVQHAVQQPQQQCSGQQQQHGQGLHDQEQEQQYHQQQQQQDSEQQQQHNQAPQQQEQQQPQQQQQGRGQQQQGNEGLHDQEQQQQPQHENQQQQQQQQPTHQTCGVMADVGQLSNQQQQQCQHHNTSTTAAAATDAVVSPPPRERVRWSGGSAAAAAAVAAGGPHDSPCSSEVSQHAEPPGTLSGRGVTQVTTADSTPRISQTQSELLLGPEVADLSFHDPATSEPCQPCPLICESFPFQKDAVAFAAWCNKAGPAAVAALQQQCRTRNFGSFHERQHFLQQYMRQQDQQQEGLSNAADAAVASDAAAADPAAAAAGSGGGGNSGFKLPWVRVFTEEYAGRNGYTRRFLAASYQALWRRHTNTPTNRRHLYEVIQERYPCHLYFDIEYNKLANPTADGDQLVNQLLALVRDQLMRMDMQSDVTLTKGCILELDSSTSEKFSRHVVVRIPGCAFRDNLQVGAFVRGLTTISDETEFLYLVKKAGSSERACLVDGAVYTKNRHFRMLGSSKGGKQALLQPTDRWAMSAAHNNDQPLQQHQLFLMSLICNVHPDSTLLDITPSIPAPQQQQQQPGQNRQQQQQQRREGLGFGGTDMMYQYPVRPDGGPVVPGIEAPAGLGRSYRSIKATWGPLGHQQQQAVVRNGESSEHLVLDPSVLQDVVLQSIWFVEDVATRRAQGVPAQVRTVAYCGQASACSRHCAFAFSLIGPGSHMCANVGRSHRNNHVFYVVDFANGAYCQKCHDPDCWGFRSPWNPLPQEVWQRTRLMCQPPP